ncbi:hypothetical protein [Vibrio atypicus]|uniref:hypothetical protein n=1 Tax=Vibrio atypicus TaxID=558271 RepID=UPI00373630F3
MRTITMYSLAVLLISGCSSNQYDTELDFNSVREITESSEHFYYTSYEYNFESHALTNTAKSVDGYVKVATDEKLHTISIDTQRLITHLFQNDAEKRLLDQKIRLITDTGQELPFKKNDYSLVVKVPYGGLKGDYIVLLSGDEYEGAVYFPLPSKTCLEYTYNAPESCSFTTDECGFIYANILDSGKILTPSFEYPPHTLACNINPREFELFRDSSLYFPSNDLECEGMSKIECIFYQR